MMHPSWKDSLALHLLRTEAMKLGGFGSFCRQRFRSFDVLFTVEPHFSLSFGLGLYLLPSRDLCSDRANCPVSCRHCGGITKLVRSRYPTAAPLCAPPRPSYDAGRQSHGFP